MCIVGDMSDSRPDQFEVLNQTFVFTGSCDSFMQAGDTLAVHSLFLVGSESTRGGMHNGVVILFLCSGRNSPH